MIISRVINGKLVSSDSDKAIVPWWSFTKTVLATATLVLVRDGKLNLDEPIKDKPYTLRQLLQHTSGLTDYGGLRDYHLAVERGETPWSTQELLAKTNAEKLLFEPGTKFSYSNIGYLFVREIIEEKTGVDLETALATLVFNKLNIEGVKVAVLPTDLDIIEGGNTGRYHPGWVYHGLLIGPLSSASLFLDRLMTIDFLQGSLKEEMLRSFKVMESIPGRPFHNLSYGLGLMGGDSSLGHCVGHTGQGPGSTIAVYHFDTVTPKLTVAGFSNINTPEEQGILEEVISTK